MAIAAVRPAAAPDVDEIIRIQTGTWAAAYAELVPPAAIEQLNSPAARQAWTEAVAVGGVLVAIEGGWTVGFCAAAAATGTEDAAPDDSVEPTLGAEAWGEIGTLLVEPRWGRRGHGGRLLAAAAETLRAAGARYGLAWMPESDEATRRFYARAGWEPDGTVRILDAGDRQLREVRVTGPLDLKLQD